MLTAAMTTRPRVNVVRVSVVVVVVVVAMVVVVVAVMMVVVVVAVEQVVAAATAAAAAVEQVARSLHRPVAVYLFGAEGAPLPHTHACLKTETHFARLAVGLRLPTLVLADDSS